MNHHIIIDNAGGSRIRIRGNDYPISPMPLSEINEFLPDEVEGYAAEDWMGDHRLVLHETCAGNHAVEEWQAKNLTYGLAEQHVLKYQDLDGQIWDWQDQPGVPHPSKSEFDDAHKRYEFADGSAIVVLGDGWDFGYTRTECEDPEIIAHVEAHGLFEDGDRDPRYVWPEIIN